MVGDTSVLMAISRARQWCVPSSRALRRCALIRFLTQAASRRRERQRAVVYGSGLWRARSNEEVEGRAVREKRRTGAGVGGEPPKHVGPKHDGPKHDCAATRKL